MKRHERQVITDMITELQDRVAKLYVHLAEDFVDDDTEIQIQIHDLRKQIDMLQSKL